MSRALRAGVATDVGPFRAVNQDAAFAASWGAAVADGVGGGPAGDLASAALVHRLVAGGPRVDGAEALADRIRAANWDLGAQVRRDPSLAGMATTFTGLWFAGDGEMLLLAHTGDSRAYLVRGGNLIRQTRDDSFVQALVDQGIVSAEDAMTHPRRNIITASLRGDATDLVRVSERVPVDGDRWLLCSDGVSDYLPDDAILGALQSYPDVVQSARALVELALEAGSRDNVTAVVCDIVDEVPEALRAPVFAGAAAARFLEGLDERAG
ncbi:protein phosphatase 2C domain-containing protein [Microbacterium sp. W1N]|uniref:PP2C family protein-serine/threonine phosphatase n=1 Tax=Microbacterium festucae TaxID=2977531 RepID=UPI0021C1E458|nr:protein phosphatase 2C domain-containing protein [Microbacterium festucae]MCT9819926.1 protein phosphatase 2C domain-containing protein [Microbacterium festucae]